jgi:hypothetical protein
MAGIGSAAVSDFMPRWRTEQSRLQGVFSGRMRSVRSYVEAIRRAA